jgi:hypothetical protein
VKENEKTYEEAYESIDEEDTSVDIWLNDFVHMGADIETAYDAYRDGVSIYNFYTDSQEHILVEDDSRVIQNINDYYGYEMVNDENTVRGCSLDTDNRITLEMIKKEKLDNDVWNLDFGKNGCVNDNPIYSYSDVYFKIPESRVTDEEEKQRLTEETDKVLNIFEEELGFTISSQYEMAHMNKTAIELAAEWGKVSNLTYLKELESDEDFYIVTVRPSTENDIPIIPRGYSLELIDSGNNKTYPENVYVGSVDVQAEDWDEITIFFDQDMKLITFYVRENMSYEKDTSNTKKIIGAKEMIGVLHDYYKNVKGKKVEIKKMKLYYMATHQGVDENGVEKYQLTPIWRVSAFEEYAPWYYCEVFDALTGEHLVTL